MSYNEAQEQAVNSIDGQVMVVSCPGSGKTTTMLKRVRAMTERGISEDSMLVMTFTEAAAKEMKERYAAQYGPCGVLFCTIHSLCYMILREGVGQMAFRVLSGMEQHELLVKAITGIKLPPHIARKDILNDISGYKNNPGKFVPRTLDEDSFRKVLEAYEMEKVSSGYIDFDDMLLKCRELLEDRNDLLNQYRRRFKYIMCDEYQDTNGQQKEILYLLAGNDGNVFVVGDDDQSIYGFRGADPNIMMDFAIDYPKCRRITMGINYRSEPEIVRAAAGLISFNEKRLPKKFEAAKQGQGVIRYLTSPERPEEISVLAAEIKRLSVTTGYPEMAVLTRTNAQLVEIAAAFEREKIPYHSPERIPDIYEGSVFGDMAAYLRLMDGTGTPADFMRVLNKPSRGLREADFSRMREVSMEEVASCENPYKANIGSGKAVQFLKDLEAFRVRPYEEQVMAITEFFQYDMYLRNLASRMNMEPSIMENKAHFLAEDALARKSLASWLASAQYHIRAHREREKAAANEGVTLSTMHRSKGLEWDAVFIPDCCKGIVPLRSSETQEEIEEERRLFYVAVTRARKNLYIMNYSGKSGRKGSTSTVKPSPFIEELDGSKIGRIRKESEAGIALKKKQEDQKDGFAEGDPRNFKKGMHVTHNQYGRGVVTMKNMVCVAVRFMTGTKMFKFGR